MVTGVPGIHYRRDEAAREWQARGRSPIEDVPLDDRPTGSNYVTYESLYATGNTFKDVLAKVPGKVLTLPAGEFTWSGFNMGYIDGLRLGNGGYTGVKGIVGSGADQTVLKQVANTTTNSSYIASETSRIGTNPTNLIQFNGITAPECAAFKLVGTPQNGNEYNGIRFQSCTDPVINSMHFLGANPGSKNAPPGETFGLNVYKSPRARLTNSEFDGRDEGGTRVCASPFGWNGTSDAYVKNCNTHHALTGMPTWWQTVNVWVEDVISYSNGTAGGGLSGQGFNLERASGQIRFIRCTSKPWGKWEKEKGNTDPDVTDNSGLHWSMNNDQQDMPDMQIIDPIHDRGPHSSGALAIYRGIPYGSGQKVTSWPYVVKNGVALQGRTSSNTSGISSATHFVIYT